MDRVYTRKSKQPDVRISGTDSASVFSNQSTYTLNASETFITPIPTDSMSNTSISISASSTSTTTPTPTTVPKSPPRPTTTQNTALNSTSNSNPRTDLHSLATHISTQSTQARHLLSQIPPTSISPTEMNWIESTITDTENAIHSVAILLEKSRVEAETNNGKLGVRTHLRWMVKDSKRAKEMRTRLVMCHGSLMGVLGRLQGLYGQVQVQVQVQGLGQGMEPVEMDGASAFRVGLGTGIAGERAPSSKWDLRVQLQDAGMEVASDPREHGLKQQEPRAEVKAPFIFQVEPSEEPKPSCPASGNLAVEFKEEDKEISPSTEAKLDTELLDMLSWHWAQVRTQQ
ncbi:hypothetical protein BDW74DRAFT_159967 [Aspergillus multicolor]|uniref:uncharacterized protein n=1 Tax=Aspergillus multicolor TaxID=41759 RepID=UPI003CCE2272